VMPDKSTLYSSALPTAYQQSHLYREYRAGERGDTPLPPYGPPAPVAPNPLDTYMASQQGQDFRAGEREYGSLVDIAGSLGVNIGVKTPGYTPPGYTPPPPPATAYPGFTVPTSSSPSLPVITLPKPQSSPTVNAQTGFVIPPPVATTPPRYLSNKLLGRAGPQDY